MAVALINPRKKIIYPTNFLLDVEPLSHLEDICTDRVNKLPPVILLRINHTVMAKIVSYARHMVEYGEDPTGYATFLDMASSFARGLYVWDGNKRLALAYHHHWSMPARVLKGGDQLCYLEYDWRFPGHSIIQRVKHNPITAYSLLMVYRRPTMERGLLKFEDVWKTRKNRRKTTEL